MYLCIYIYIYAHTLYIYIYIYVLHRERCICLFSCLYRKGSQARALNAAGGKNPRKEGLSGVAMRKTCTNDRVTAFFSWIASPFLKSACHGSRLTE